jgi:hypothetical protein
VGKPEAKRELGRFRRRWENNIKMDRRGMGCVGVHCIDLAQGREQWRDFFKTVMNWET